ncbi:GLPGLI family protein [Fodinibius halophilus]|uniref:GLPGLI family protein n=1 Tax=Fodinibius halophilus TaxID=1736908 RepID=A0A6M1TMG0_9BACT|nr:GLPGLI family protein [Fodinibius halophilus]NGP89590.1 GLPGLI family protein [Fodinibius halophilus]
MYKFLLLILPLTIQSVYGKQHITTADSLTGMVIYSQRISLRTPVFTTDTLKFNRQRSIFSWNLYNDDNKLPDEIKKRFPSAQIPEDVSVSRKTGQTNYYDAIKDSLFSRKSMRHINKVLYLQEKKPTISWNISDSTKKIGNYTVQKATASFRGRSYTAWFTPEIPVPFGPWKLNGLPGLILEAYDQSGNIYFSATTITFTDVGPIDPIQRNGKEQVVTLDQYKKIMQNFRKEMRNKVVKKARAVLSQQEIANMKINLPDIELMETFDNDTP